MRSTQLAGCHGYQPTVFLRNKDLGCVSFFEKYARQNYGWNLPNKTGSTIPSEQKHLIEN